MTDMRRPDVTQDDLVRLLTHAVQHEWPDRDRRVAIHSFSTDSVTLSVEVDGIIYDVDIKRVGKEET